MLTVKKKKKCVKSKDAVNLHLVATEPSAANGSLRVLLADEHDDDHFIEGLKLQHFPSQRIFLQWTQKGTPV